MEYWNAPGFVPAPMPQVAAQPAPFVVGDYTKKKRIADALRTKADAKLPGQLDPLGKSEGANGAPGEVYINWGNILSNAAQPWLKGWQEEKAAAAEDEATAARREALGRLTGKESPEQLLAAGEELGIPDLTKSALKKMVPEALNPAQRAQSSTSKAGLLALYQMGELSPEEYEQAVTNIDAETAAEVKRNRDDYVFEQRNKTFAPSTRAPTAEETKFNLWQGANPGKNYNDYLASLSAGDRASATEQKRMYAIDDKLNTASNSLDRISNLQDIINDPTSNLFSTPQKAAGALNRFGESLGGGAGSVLQSVAAGLIDPDAMITKKEAIRLATQDLQMVGGNDSNYELSKMLEQYPDNAMSKESAIALIHGLYRVTAINRRALELESEALRDGTYGSKGGLPKGGFWQQAKRELDGEVDAPPQGGSDDDLLNKYAPK